MDISGVADASDNLIKSLMFEIEIAHYFLVIYGVRMDWDSKKARKQPVATWLMSVACCFGGGMLVSIALGKPALTPLSNNTSVLMMTTIWWLVFYSPMDSIFSLLSWKPALIIVAVLKEMIRTRKVIKGVKLSRAVFPDSLLICTLLGMLAACGGGYIKNAAVFVRKNWDHESVKTLYFSPISKLAFLFSLLYNLQLRGVIGITFNTVVLMQFVTMSLFAVVLKAGFKFDPFHPFEKIITSLTVDYSAFVSDEPEKAGSEEEKSKVKSTKPAKSKKAEPEEKKSEVKPEKPAKAKKID